MLMKKIVSIGMVLIMLLAMSVDVLACKPTAPPPTCTTPAKVSVNKTAKWVDDEYAQVTLEVNGTPNLQGGDFVIVMDKSTSMKDYNRLANAKEACNKLVDELFAPIKYIDEAGVTKTAASNNRISFMSFGTCAYTFDCGKFYTASDANGTKIKKHINSLSVMKVASNYNNPVYEAYDVIGDRSKTDQSRPAHVIMISSGETKEYSCFKDYVAKLHKVTSSVSTVGLNLTNTTGRSLLQRIVKAPGVYIEANNDVNVMIDSYKALGGYALSAGVITDQMGDKFSLVPNSTQYPWTFTVNGVKTEMNGLTVKDDAFSFVLGGLNGKATLTYYIKIKDGTPAGTYDTNTFAKLSYTNTLGKASSLTFPVPKLTYAPKYTFTVSHQYGDSAPVVTTTPATYGQSIITKPVYKPEYEFKSVTVKAVDANNNPVANNLVVNANNEVTGTMPKGNVTIEYKYAPLSNILYLVNYYQDAVGGKLLGTKTGLGSYGDEIVLSDADLYAYLPVGYDRHAVRTGATHIGFGGNIVNVVYDQKTQMYRYGVEYYTEDGELLGRVAHDPVYAGTTIILTPKELDLFKPSDDYESGIQVGGPTVILNNTTLIKVVYKAKKVQTIEVNHYLEAMDGSGRFNLFNKSVESAYSGDVLTVAELQIPVGGTHSYGYSDSPDGAYYIVKDGNNVVNLYYYYVPARMANEDTIDQEIPMYRYGVEYRTGDGRLLGRVAYDPVYEGTRIILTSEELDLFRPEGYGSGVQVNGSASVVQNTPLIKVVYNVI